MLGHKIAGQFGRVMRAGYIPDPFGHVAQLPQILAGFGINNFLFARGFGNEYAELGLKMDFEWQAPGNAASVLGIHLVAGYGSVAGLSTQKDAAGRYTSALKRIRGVVDKLKQHAATNWIILNNGSDHLFPQPHVPALVKQWNEANPDETMVNADFEFYATNVLAAKPTLKTFQGELRGGKYENLLSAVFSARMWIKQWNARCETILEKYTEPVAALAAVLAGFEYPRDYIWQGWKWLLQNHPHDSICGCSIDQVHDEMRTRFMWAESIAREVYKDALLAISARVQLPRSPDADQVVGLVYNPNPWPYTGPVALDVALMDLKEASCPQDIEVYNSSGDRVLVQNVAATLPARYHSDGMTNYRFTILAKDLPPLGYEVVQLRMVETAKPMTSDLAHQGTTLENRFYKLTFNADGSFNLLDKETKQDYKNLGILEDMGDWGDEYDYSWPPEGAKDALIFSKGRQAEVILLEDGPAKLTAQVALTLPIPKALAPGRKGRMDEAVPTPFAMQVSLLAGVKRVDIKLTWNNQSKDHRVRALFPSTIKATSVQADGHFHVVDRKVDKPDDHDWNQKYVGPNHQNMFVNVQGAGRGLAVCNRGLPEYEALKETDGSVTLAITLLRCIGWLSRGDFATRKGNAGPDLETPGAQMQGPFEAQLAITTHAGDWCAGEVHRRAREFNAPARLFLPDVVQGRSRADNILFLGGLSSVTGAPQAGKKDLPARLSAIAISPPELELTALKQAEDGTGTILRLVNVSSKDVTGRVSLWQAPKAVSVVDLNEQAPQRNIKGSATLKGKDVAVTLGANVILTLKVSF
jgi:mannosylglycerate hydrolase